MNAENCPTTLQFDGSSFVRQPEGQFIDPSHDLRNPTMMSKSKSPFTDGKWQNSRLGATPEYCNPDAPGFAVVAGIEYSYTKLKDRDAMEGESTPTYLHTAPDSYSYYYDWNGVQQAFLSTHERVSDRVVAVHVKVLRRAAIAEWVAKNYPDSPELVESGIATMTGANGSYFYKCD
jgi:hypothetical protein